MGIDSTAPVSALMRQCRESIARFGWNLTATPGFAYTTGLTAGDHPEILVAGLDPYTAHDVASAAIARIRAGIPLKPGNHYPAIADGFLVEIRAIGPADAPRFPRSVTTAYYGHPVPAVQVVFPDKRGRFPGEPGCDRTVAALQDGSTEASDA